MIFLLILVHTQKICSDRNYTIISFKIVEEKGLSNYSLPEYS